jgi:hypothetical protein
MSKENEDTSTTNFTGYSLQARVTTSNACISVGPLHLDGVLRTLAFRELRDALGLPGLERHGMYDSNARHELVGLMSYATAEALRWALHAQDAYGHLETRLIEHEVEISTRKVVIGDLKGSARSGLFP